mgnify:CR=1 FL=1
MIDLAWRIEEPDYPGRAYPARREDNYLRCHGWALHVCLLRVKDDENGCQVAWQSDFQEEVEALQTLCGDGRLESMTIDGLEGQWLLCITNHGDG